MRVESYRVELLSREELLIGVLDGVEVGGRLTGNVNAQIRWSGTLTYHGGISKSDWLKYRLRVVATIDGVDCPLGVYVVRGGEEKTMSAGSVLTLDLYDKTFIPSSDAVEDTYSIAAGTRLDAAIRALLVSTGDSASRIDTAQVTTTSLLTWEAGTSKLRIINDLLDSVGYMALWCDFSGAYRLTPYTEPKKRPVAYSFTCSESAIHTCETARSQDAKVANKIICLSQETGEKPAMRAVAVNEDPSSPYSYQSQGVWVCETYTGIEAASQSVLDATAQRYLTSVLSSATVKRQMALTPLELNSVCVSDTGGREVVENIDITLTPATLMSVTTREVK